MAHRSPITCVDHHSGAGLTVTGGYDGRVIAWSSVFTPVWETAFDDLVNDVRFDAGGGQIAVAVADGHAFVLDSRTGARFERLGPHGDDVNAVRWSPDGRRLVCVMDHLDTAIRLWERVGDTGWRDSALEGHEHGVFGAAFDPTGRYLATVAEDASARIWDLERRRLLHVLEHPGDPEALDWSPSGDVIVTGCDDGIARVWNPLTGSLVHELTDASAAVRFLRFDAAGDRLLAGAYDATLRVYDCRSWRVVDQYQGAFQWERAACFVGAEVVVGSFSAVPMVHFAGRAVGVSSDPVALTHGINTLSVRDGECIVGRDDGAVVDLARGDVLTRHDTIVNTVSVSPDGRTVVSGDYRGVLHLTPRGDSGAMVASSADGGGPINSVVWDPNGTRFFTGGYDGMIRQWSPEGRCMARWQAHQAPIKSLAWSTTTQALIVGSSDGSLSSWLDGQERWRARHDELVLVNAVAVADDDGAGVVVTASRDLLVRRWDVVTGRLLETLPHGHIKSVKAVSVSPGGDRIVTGSYDGSALLWVRDAADLRWSWEPLRHHGKPGVPAVALGTDGSIYTAGWDGTVAIWTLTGELADVL